MKAVNAGDDILETKDYLKILKNDIHSAVFATVDENGLVIDIMLADENGVYFITAKGKRFYKQLMENKYAAISGMTAGESSIKRKAVSLRGKVENIGQERLDEIFKENPYMEKIYPTADSRNALEVFLLNDGQGEYFDLSSTPIFRDEFVIGNRMPEKQEYFVNDKCRGCKICYSKCPQKCIDIKVKPVRIRQENCLRCGNCYDVCPFGAVERKI